MLPDSHILDAYADVLIRFALNSGSGIRAGEVVNCVVPDVAKPLALSLHKSVLKAGGHPMIRLLPTGLDRQFYEYANHAQRTFFPKAYLKARVNLIDHQVGIIADHDLHELEGVDPTLIMETAETNKPVRTWLNRKEYQGKFTWVLALYGTPAMAAEAKMTLEEYWDQIIKACQLDTPDPIASWKAIIKKQQKVMAFLNSLPIESLHMKGADSDLRINLGEKRRFVGGSGRNIPSYEIFTSPDWRGAEGWVRFDQPLYRYGSLINNIRLELKAGRVIKATSDSNQSLLRQMIARPNADKLGEFSLTDGTMSPITKFMANTLFDENIGGRYGNSHIAVGMSYKDCFDGDPNEVKPATWKALGFNDSGEHCDMIQTTDRTVTATLNDGSTRVIYRDGSFVLTQ